MSSFQSLLKTSLDVLATEHPQAYRDFWVALIRQRIRFLVDDESVDVVADHKQVIVSPSSAEPTTTIACPGETVVDLFQGETGFLDALLSDQVQIFGSSAQLEAANTTLMIWIRGGLGCPGFPPLLDLFRQQISRR